MMGPGAGEVRWKELVGLWLAAAVVLSVLPRAAAASYGVLLG